MLGVGLELFISVWVGFGVAVVIGFWTGVVVDGFVGDAEGVESCVSAAILTR